MSFAERMSDAEEWELKLLGLFNDRPDCVANRFGQGMLTPDMRKALIRLPYITLLRWMPDLIVATADRVVLIDAKYSPRRPETGNHSVESQSTVAAVAFGEAMGIGVYYAFWHEGDRPMFVGVDAWDILAQAGPPPRIGRTLYHLGRCDSLCLTWEQLNEQEALNEKEAV